MNAVVLAGGFGSRLMPLTKQFSKPMLSVANVPMIDYTIAHLASFGIKNIVFTLGYLPRQIKQFISGYNSIIATCVTEDIPLGTAGGVLAASKYLDDTFIVLSGDALEDINLGALMHKHVSSGADITVAVTQTKNPHLYGVVQTDAFGTITNFIEKPPLGTAKSNLISCGVYVINKSVLGHVNQQRSFDFARDLFPIILNSGKISAYIHDGYWCDIGDIESYYNANFHFTSGGFFKPVANQYTVNNISYLTHGLNPNLIACGCSVVGQTRNSIIGQGARVCASGSVDNCIVMPGTVVEGRYLNCIIGSDYVVPVTRTTLNLDKIQQENQINF